MAASSNPASPVSAGDQAQAPSSATGYRPTYWDANASKPKSFYDYEKFTIEWGDMDPYLCHLKIGRGKYSEVLTATNRLINQPCVVKMLKPVKEKRLQREVLILQHLCGVPNVITLYDMVLDEETGTPALVFESVRNTDFKQLYPTFNDVDVRYYFYELFRTLDIVHAMGFFHRDVKPQNICIDHQQRKIRLIDWGLAEFYHFGQEYNVRVASRYFKGPELLVGYRLYDHTLDSWSVGCMLAAIIFRKEVFFHGSSNEDQLDQIANVLSTQAVVDYAQSLGLPPQNVPQSYHQRPIQRKPWSTFIKSTTPLATRDAVSLVDGLLVVDHRQRLTPRQAMAHPFFDPIRSMMPPPGSFAAVDVAAFNAAFGAPGA